MVRVNRWAAVAFTAAFPLLGLLIAGTSNLQAAAKEDIERSQRETWQMGIDLDMPGLQPQAVLYAIFDKDPVPAFVAQVDRMRKHNRQQLEKADNKIGKEQLRAIQMHVGWDLGFKEVTGDKLYLLTKLPGSSYCMMSNSPDGKKWVVTKTVHIAGKPVCWCIPVEVKTGKNVDVTFDKSNTFDLRAVYDSAMREPLDVGDKDRMKKLAEDAVRKEFPEITSRETMDWGEVTKVEGGAAIRCKYLAKFCNKNTKIMNQVFTFDAQGKLLSVKDVEGFPKAW